MNLKSKAISEIRSTMIMLAAYPECADRIEGLQVLLTELEAEQVRKGMPTSQEIKEAADSIANKIHGDYPTQAKIHYKVGIIEGAEWAISQMQPEWVAITDVWKSKESVDRFNNTSQSLIMVLFDNGDIVRWIDEHPFAEITHVHFLPQPPTK